MIRTIRAFATAACWGCVLSGGVQTAEAQTTRELAGVVRPGEPRHWGTQFTIRP